MRGVQVVDQFSGTRLAHLSPRFFSFFARFHRLAETVPTSRKPEPRAKKQCQGGPNTVLPVGLTPGVRNAWKAIVATVFYFLSVLSLLYYYVPMNGNCPTSPIEAITSTPRDCHIIPAVTQPLRSCYAEVLTSLVRV